MDSMAEVQKRLTLAAQHGKIVLNPVLNAGNRAQVILGSTIAFILLYGLPNRYHLVEPRLLPLLWADRMTPFLVESIWIYLSAMFMMFAAFFLLNEIKSHNQLVMSFGMLALMSVTVFWILPTTYPRADFPIPLIPTSWAERAFLAMREADSPANCFPSLHVGVAYLSAFSLLWEKRKRAFFGFFIWASAVWISTLTTKQHYWIDGFFGFWLAGLVAWFFDRKVILRL